MIAKKVAKPIPVDEDESALFIRKDVWETEDGICNTADPSHQKPHKYVFVDVGNRADESPYNPPSERPILVRECDGTLRHAKASERSKYGQQLWGSAYYQKV